MDPGAGGAIVMIGAFLLIPTIVLICIIHFMFGVEWKKSIMIAVGIMAVYLFMSMSQTYEENRRRTVGYADEELPAYT
jgi:hypothetical protein